MFDGKYYFFFMRLLHIVDRILSTAASSDNFQKNSIMTIKRRSNYGIHMCKPSINMDTEQFFDLEILKSTKFEELYSYFCILNCILRFRKFKIFRKPRLLVPVYMQKISSTYLLHIATYLRKSDC